MHISQVRATADPAIIAELIGVPFASWAHQCHSISLKVLRTGVFGPGRIARGTHPQVTAQHSWIVLGDDVYDPDAIVVDPTLWSYSSWVSGIWVSPNLNGHRPYGLGSIWDWFQPCPASSASAVIELTPSEPLSPAARHFLDQVEPMDIRGWHMLAHSPLQGWPAGEILAAMHDTSLLRAMIPVDALGMLTDRNPGKLYR